MSGERPLRIAYLFQQFPLPTETFAVSDIEALRSLGHEVHVFTMRARRPDEERRRETGQVPDDLPIDQGTAGRGRRLLAATSRRSALLRLLARLVPALPRSPRRAAEGLACLPRALEIADRIAAGRFDVVHAFWSRHVAMALPALEREAPHLVRSAFAGAYDLVADDLLVDIALESADVAFSHAEANRAFLLDHGVRPDTVHIVPRGIPLFELDRTIARDPFRVMTASALVKAKNGAGVIRAFARARAAEPRLTLDIFGDGPDREALVRLARSLGCDKAVTFHGHQPRSVVVAAMARSAAFVLLSNKASERLPNVLKEAMWAGCALVTSPSQGLEELIPGPDFGCIVPPDGTDETAAALLSVLAETPADRAARQARTQDRIAALFSAQTSMARYVDAWRAAMNRAR